MFIRWPNQRQAGIFKSQNYTKAFPSYQSKASPLKYFLAPKKDFTLDLGLELTPVFHYISKIMVIYTLFRKVYGDQEAECHC